MEITHGHLNSYAPISAKHRGTGLTFKHLSRGDPHTPENYIFTLGKQASFYSPRHRHNFDQFRYAYQGSFSLTPSLTLEEGHLAYHPEGVHYGPQDDGPEERVLLVLQCGGASGAGYMTFEQLGEAGRKLCEETGGRFEGGKFWEKGQEVREGGGKDSYEAIWEFVNPGMELVYRPGGYEHVVMINPRTIEWVEVQGQKGVWTKALGLFSERGLRAEMLKIEKGGELRMGGNDAVHLFFVLSGQGRAGEETLQKEGTVTLRPGTEAVFTSESESGFEMLHYEMPMLKK